MANAKAHRSAVEMYVAPLIRWMPRTAAANASRSNGGASAGARGAMAAPSPPSAVPSSLSPPPSPSLSLPPSSSSVPAKDTSTRTYAENWHTPTCAAGASKGATARGAVPTAAGGALRRALRAAARRRAALPKTVRGGGDSTPWGRACEAERKATRATGISAHAPASRAALRRQTAARRRGTPRSRRLSRSRCRAGARRRVAGARGGGLVSSSTPRHQCSRRRAAQRARATRACRRPGTGGPAAPQARCQAWTARAQQRRLMLS